MSWDVFLNLGERDDQSAYHEFFLAIQVEEGKPFMLDELNLYGNFDTGWWNPINTEVGISLQGLSISQPNHEPDTTEPSTEPSTEPASEPAEEPAAEPSTEQDTDLDESPDEPFDLNENRASTPTKSGCSTANNSSSWLWLLSAIILIRERKKIT
jgi:hypothetical protein